MHSGYLYNRLCFAPPLVISKAEIERALTTIDSVISQAEAKFGLVNK